MNRLWTALASFSLLVTLLVAAWSYARSPQPHALTPSLTGKTEYCLTCHGDLPEISNAHPIETFGCVSCHGGERLALDADLAHSTLRGGRNPSDLSVVQTSCGGELCHSGNPDEYRDHIQRVLASLQVTYAGAIAQVLYTFGAQPDLTARYGIFPIQDEYINSSTSVLFLAKFDPQDFPTTPILTFAENCLNCHLSSEPLPGKQYAHFTGCAACHTLTTGKDMGQQFHQLTTSIPYSQCDTCHNRGNYDLGDMQFHPRTDQPEDRLQDYYQSIAQFTQCEWELDCVDCHTRKEVMGDGDLHSNQRQMEYVSCYTCHGTLNQPPLTYTISDPNDIALRQAFLNPIVELNLGDIILRTEKGEPLWNIHQLSDGSFEMITKVAGTRYPLPLVAGSACQQQPDQQESKYCHACHAIERQDS